jgi:hypothetical protein
MTLSYILRDEDESKKPVQRKPWIRERFVHREKRKCRRDGMRKKYPHTHMYSHTYNVKNKKWEEENYIQRQEGNEINTLESSPDKEDEDEEAVSQTTNRVTVGMTTRRKIVRRTPSTVKERMDEQGG